LLIVGVELVEISPRVDASQRSEGVLEAKRAAADSEFSVFDRFDRHFIAGV
jgi:hypothetical protein